MEEEKPKKKRKKKAGDQTPPPSGHPSYSGGEKEHKPNWRETHASKQDITEFLNGVILLRHNVITDKPEFRVPDCDEFEALGMKYPTGRWLPFEVESIESPHDYPFDHEAVFAQAYALYRRGFRYWFNEREMQLMARHNERFEVAKPERELISKYYRLPRRCRSRVCLTQMTHYSDTSSCVPRPPMRYAREVCILMCQCDMRV